MNRIINVCPHASMQVLTRMALSTNNGVDDLNNRFSSYFAPPPSRLPKSFKSRVSPTSRREEDTSRGTPQAQPHSARAALGSAASATDGTPRSGGGRGGGRTSAGDYLDVLPKHLKRRLADKRVWQEPQTRAAALAAHYPQPSPPPRVRVEWDGVAAGAGRPLFAGDFRSNYNAA